MTGGTIDLDELLDPERFAPRRLTELDIPALLEALAGRRRGLRTVLVGRPFAHLRPAWAADITAIEAELRQRGIEPPGDAGGRA